MPRNDANNDDSVAKTALVLKALLRGEEQPEDPLAEVGALAQTAGMIVEDGLVQRLERPHPATYLGKGKVEEAAERAAARDVDFVLTDNDLSPAQERNLERITGRTVIDRSQLIMDIFAQRAQTHQAKLQVELAQLRYSLPRLKRLWTHLSRYEGGIGMRGPGETQLETDRRLISKRIQRLVRELKRVERRRETTLVHRSREFVAALVGYTNAGKSTLLNALTGSSELVEDKLFATLDTRVRRWPLERKQYVLLTDTVGFIHDLPPHLVASFHATLAETRYADLLLHVVDASSRDATLQMQTVHKVLRVIDCALKPTWLILNKWDRIPPDRLIDARHLGFHQGNAAPIATPNAPPDGARDGEPQSFPVSALTGSGLDKLREAVFEYLKRGHSRLCLAVPHGRGDVLAYLEENSSSLETEHCPDAVQVHCTISPARQAKLRHMFPEGFDGDDQARK